MYYSFYFSGCMGAISCTFSFSVFFQSVHVCVCIIEISELFHSSPTPLPGFLEGPNEVNGSRHHICADGARWWGCCLVPVMDRQQADCMGWWSQSLELITCPVEPLAKYPAFPDVESLAQPSTLGSSFRSPGSGIRCVFLGKGE